MHACFEMDQDDLESTVESISAIAYAFSVNTAMDLSSIRGWRSREPAGLG